MNTATPTTGITSASYIDTLNCQEQQQEEEEEPEPFKLQRQLQATILKPIYPSTIEEDECRVRKNNSDMYDRIGASAGSTFHCNSIVLFLVNTYSSLGIFTLHLISYESIISILLSVGLTLYIYFSIFEDENDDRAMDFHGNTMNWVLLTFAVVTPIGAAIQMVFTRREYALLQISTLRSTFIQLYNSYTIWGWDYQPYRNEMLRHNTNGRTKSNLDWLEHSDLALREILFICDDLIRYVAAIIVVCLFYHSLQQLIDVYSHNHIVLICSKWKTVDTAQ